jgi:hypothetical protein
MERDFVVRVEGQKGFIHTRTETVLGVEVEAYSYVGARRKATVFRGAPEDDVALLERLSLYLGRWKRDLVVDELVRRKSGAPRLLLVRVAHSVRHPEWVAGSWVRAEDDVFKRCSLSEAQIFTSRRVVETLVTVNQRNHNVEFEVVSFAEVRGQEEAREP